MGPNNNGTGTEQSISLPTRRRELAVFLLATFVIIPGLAIAFVGGYGFVIWAFQMIFGPPGPPV